MEWYYSIPLVSDGEMMGEENNKISIIIVISVVTGFERKIRGGVPINSCVNLLLDISFR